MTISKLRFGDALLSMAKTRCKSDVLTFDPTTQKLREILDILQKNRECGIRAEQCIDKTIYAKIPDNVKKILNRVFRKDEPCVDIVLHLEREMRLNGLGTPDEITLVPLYKIESIQP